MARGSIDAAHLQISRNASDHFGHADAPARAYHNGLFSAIAMNVSAATIIIYTTIRLRIVAPLSATYPYRS